jgi:hypothetical protein
MLKATILLRVVKLRFCEMVQIPDRQLVNGRVHPPMNFLNPVSPDHLPSLAVLVNRDMSVVRPIVGPSLVNDCPTENRVGALHRGQAKRIWSMESPEVSAFRLVDELSVISDALSPV